MPNLRRIQKRVPSNYNLIFWNEENSIFTLMLVKNRNGKPMSAFVRKPVTVISFERLLKELSKLCRGFPEVI